MHIMYIYIYIYIHTYMYVPLLPPRPLRRALRGLHNVPWYTIVQYNIKSHTTYNSMYDILEHYMIYYNIT